MSVFFLIILAILVLVIIQSTLGGIRGIKKIYSDLMESSVGMFIALIVVIVGVPAILLLLGWFMIALLA